MRHKNLRSLEPAEPKPSILTPVVHADWRQDGSHERHARLLRLLFAQQPSRTDSNSDRY